MTATTPTPSRRSRSSTNSRAGEPPELEQFVAFCGELRLDTREPFVVEDFQRTVLRDFFDGATETLVLLPKKNGKSTLVAALALFHLLTVRDAECYIAASSREQAGIILKQARKFIASSESLSRLFDVNKREIQSLADEGVVKVLASDVDTADGVIPTLAVVDEMHRAKSTDLYGVFRDGLGPRSGQMITISTAGEDEMSPLGKMRAGAYKLPMVEQVGPYRYARSHNGDFVMHEWALDPADDLDDLEVVATANPASWQTVEALRRRHDSPSTMPWQWARFACGVWVQGEDSAISPVDWAARAKPGYEIPAGSHVWLGIDLGWKWDTTALVPLEWVSPDDRRLGRPTVIVPPRDGTSTDPRVIQDAVLEIHDRTPLHTVVLDPNAGGEQLAAWIEEHTGARVVAHSQDPAPMSRAAERFAEALREGSLSHPADEVLTAHVLAAKAKTTTGEKWKLVKHRRPIDAAIAAAMVHSIAADNAVGSVYEDRDLLVL